MRRTSDPVLAGVEQALSRNRDRHAQPGTWAQLARALNITDQRLSNWHRRGIPASAYRGVASALGMTLDFMVRGEGLDQSMHAGVSAPPVLRNAISDLANASKPLSEATRTALAVLISSVIQEPGTAETIAHQVEALVATANHAG